MPAPEAGAMVRLSVCYARPERVFLQEIEVPAGTTIIGAVQASGLVQACPEVDPNTMRVGIFGKLKTLDTVVRVGDRVEIYRALTADPKQARRKRVQKTRESGTREGQKWLRGKAGADQA
ncbi:MULTISPECIES: RnfH family protein [unclassified Cupriavidus]|uniref:RnfH family protein n=1 Tax=Cupriavidus sp. H19C3 TaxID=3241603 RepID=UPI003BF839FF